MARGLFTAAQDEVLKMNFSKGKLRTARQTYLLNGEHVQRDWTIKVKHIQGHIRSNIKKVLYWSSAQHH